MSSNWFYKIPFGICQYYLENIPYIQPDNALNRPNDFTREQIRSRASALAAMWHSLLPKRCSPSLRLIPKPIHPEGFSHAVSMGKIPAEWAPTGCIFYISRQCSYRHKPMRVESQELLLLVLPLFVCWVLSGSNKMKLQGCKNHTGSNKHQAQGIRENRWQIRIGQYENVLHNYRTLLYLTC